MKNCERLTVSIEMPDIINDLFVVSINSGQTVEQIIEQYMREGLTKWAADHPVADDF